MRSGRKRGSDGEIRAVISQFKVEHGLIPQGDACAVLGWGAPRLREAANYGAIRMVDLSEYVPGAERRETNKLRHFRAEDVERVKRGGASRLPSEALAEWDAHLDALRRRISEIISRPRIQLAAPAPVEQSGVERALAELTNRVSLLEEMLSVRTGRLPGA